MRVYYNEFDKKKCAALKALMEDGHISKGDIDDRPIQEVQGHELQGYTRCHFFAGFGGWDIALQLAGWEPGRPVCTVSCPCQPYSSSGSSERQQDERHLWPYFARLARESRFPEIIGEQVDEAIAAGWLDDAFLDLEAENYACAAAVFPAFSVEAKAERQRLYFSAYAIGLRLPEPRRYIHAVSEETAGFGEAAPFIAAVQGNALPFLCERHPRIRPGVCHIVNHGIGDSIVPEQAAEFIKAYRECVA